MIDERNDEINIGIKTKNFPIKNETIFILLHVNQLFINSKFTGTFKLKLKLKLFKII